MERKYLLTECGRPAGRVISTNDPANYAAMVLALKTPGQERHISVSIDPLAGRYVASICGTDAIVLEEMAD